VSVLAGTAGQRMVNAAAERMLSGRSDLALVVRHPEPEGG